VNKGKNTHYFLDGDTLVYMESSVYQNVLKQVNQLIEDHTCELEQLKSGLAEVASSISDHDIEIQQLKDEILHKQSELAASDLLFIPEYQARLEYYRQVVDSPLTSEAKQILALIRETKYRGIVVYPHAVRWEPIQRPQQILMEFARKGYLCFFCDISETFSITEVEDGLFVVSHQEYLLQALQTTHVLVLNTFLMQNPWIELLPHKSIWYDVLDRVDFFSLYDRNMLGKHFQILHEADIVTYSAHQLKEYVMDRADAIYLPNASRMEDFSLLRSDVPEIPHDLKSIVNKNKKIIGYYGAIEEWFDSDLVINLASKPQIEIVLIGHCGISKQPFPENVHFLGPKPYSSLKNYAAYFDALMIPFKINKLTNAVSPVKFFEYCAVGKPIISTRIAEMIAFEGPGITFVSSEERIEFIPSWWELSKEAKKHLRAIAANNQWKSRCETIVHELESIPSCLRVFANRNYERHVGVFAATFLDFNGANYYSGGAERYLVDLHEACSELGLKLDIYQYGHYPWYRKYKDIDVYSLGHDTLDMQEFSVENLSNFNRRYLYAAEEQMLLNIYSAFFQAYPGVAHPSIGISHGVAWDQPGCNYEDGTQFWANNERFLHSAKQVQKMVSVDTNTPNWFQTIFYSSGQRMMTIPNYVDPKEFFPIEKKKDSKIRIVYPRRLYEARGLYLTLNIVDHVLSNYPRTEFHFVGKGFEEDVEQINKSMKRWPGRIFCYHRDPDEMHHVYKEADIVLIPTLYSEGTSLSCLEACATGNAVIATRVGGLTDIIIDHFNGLLITPDSNSLANAIIECLEKPELRKRLGKNAIEVSRAFDKATWKERWKTVIKEQLSINEQSLDPKLKAPSTRTIEFQLAPHTKKEDWMPEAVRCLGQGMALFIRGDQEMENQTSFGRVQWLSKNDELYFQPEIKRFE